MILLKDLPRNIVTLKELEEKNRELVDLFVELKIKPSKAEVKRLIAGNALTINGQKLNAEQVVQFNLKDLKNWIADIYLIVKFGKKEFHVIELK